MKNVARILWYVTYIPAGMALFFTMALGIGLIMLVFDIVGLIINERGEFPPGFFVIIYSSLFIRIGIAQIYDWDITEFTIRN